MRASVREDTTTRTITLDVGDVPDIDATKSWHAKGTRRIFRPDMVVVRMVDGEVREVKVGGALVRKSGQLSNIREDQRWRLDGGRGLEEKLSAAPEWVRTLAREVPEGVTSWITPEEVPA